MTSFIRLKALSLRWGVSKEKGEGGGKGWGEYTHGGRDWKDRRVAVDRRHFPRRVVPVNNLLNAVWEVGVLPVFWGTGWDICPLVVLARTSVGGDSGWEEFAVDGYRVVVVLGEVG